SSINVNELEDVDLPIAISETVKPSCAGMDNGSITFNLQPDNAFPEMRWELYRLDDPIPTEVSGGGPIAANVTYTDILEFPNLEAGEYYLEVVQVDASDTDTCFGASENIRVRQQLRPDADVTSIADIGCNLPGLISVTNINGGTEPYTFNVIGPGGLLITTTQNPIEIPANSPEDYYTVIITDVYGCNSNSLGQIYMKLTPNPEIDALQVDNCDGNIEVTVTGSSAAGGLRYAMVTHGLPAPTAFLYNSGIFKGVAPGIYDFYVIDANGCTN